MVQLVEEEAVVQVLLQLVMLVQEQQPVQPQLEALQEVMEILILPNLDFQE
jgi:hypothetical protein